MSQPEWIAVDWGTSRLRAYPMMGETAGEEISSDRGMGSLERSEFEPALLELIAPWLGPRTTVIAGGMQSRSDDGNATFLVLATARVAGD